MAQSFEGRLNWSQLVMDCCFLFQLRLFYLWLHKSLPHKIREDLCLLLIPHCASVVTTSMFPSSTWNHGNSTLLLVFCSESTSCLSWSGRLWIHYISLWRYDHKFLLINGLKTLIEHIFRWILYLLLYLVCLNNKNWVDGKKLKK